MEQLTECGNCDNKNPHNWEDCWNKVEQAIEDSRN